MIPVIDIFAGPGGLSEGFSSLKKNNQRIFPIRLSVENKDEPFRTLRLRAFFRQFQPSKAPEDYYRLLRGEIKEQELYTLWPDQAKIAASETWQATLGECDQKELNKKVSEAITGFKDWILIGGPPCQAYSRAGVVGNRTRKDYCPEKDTRYGLYREFIRVLATHKPSAFVLENVPGMLSARLGNKRIIDDLLLGLARPGDFIHREFGEWPEATHYRLVSPISGIQGLGGDPRVFIVRSEEFGLPQTRHRVIIIGIREDKDPSRFRLLERKPSIDMNSVIDDLPHLRSSLSREPDSLKTWRSVFSGLQTESWYKEIKKSHSADLAGTILACADRLLKSSPKDPGADFIRCAVSPMWNSDWYTDQRLEGVCHHETRPHIRSDLHRYLFCSCFGAVNDRSPKLPDFPQGLLPNHHNSRSGRFKDRFRVLLGNRPSCTIISHLAKDGHAFIHPDPVQCRSLTPREAARIQTFQDNYFFFGGRTSKFHQIGNAVPPLLARLIADSLHEIFYY
jgi:DNA (cytosine-5)-methyltransferase 1